MLSLMAKSQPVDVMQGFGMGGNDYLRKLFSLDELVVRLRELPRRAPTAPALPAAVPLCRYVFVPQRQELWLGG